MKNSAPYCQNLSSAMLISQLFSFYLTSLIEYIYIYPRILSVSLNYILCSEEDLQILLTKKLKFWLKRMACVRSRHACNSCEEWGTIFSTTVAIMHSRYYPLSTITSLIHQFPHFLLQQPGGEETFKSLKRQLKEEGGGAIWVVLDYFGFFALFYVSPKAIRLLQHFIFGPKSTFEGGRADPAKPAALKGNFHIWLNLRLLPGL